MSKDTSFQCSATSRSFKQRKFCDSERFYSKSNNVNGQSVYSRNGNLYLTWENIDTLLLETEDYFDSKFGSGYYQPHLSPDGKSLLFRELGGLSLAGDNGSLLEMNLDTKEIKTILDQTCVSPQYSSNGKFIVFGKRQEIYLYEIVTNKKTKVGIGDLFSIN
jgi:Tol biopolymer transport system component